MKASNKWLYALLAFAPLPLFALYFYKIFSLMPGMMSGNIQSLEPASTESILSNYFQTIIPIAILLVLVSITALIVFLMHIVKNEKFDHPHRSTEKVVWILVVVLTGFLGNLVYFFMEIMPKKSDDQIVLQSSS